jgi:hypothetical protein
LRFPLNNALYDLKLSQNARCVIETCNIPSITNLAGKYVLLRMVTSSQDKTCAQLTMSTAAVAAT